MNIFNHFTKDQWFSNVRGDVLSGLVVALALIPEQLPFPSLQGLTQKWGCMRPFALRW